MSIQYNIEVRYVTYNSKIHNQNNITELTPFKNYSADATHEAPYLYILREFYNKLSAYPFIMVNMMSYYKAADKNNILICDTLPEQPCNDDTGYWIVYRTWCRMYNADIWYHVFGNLTEIVSLTPEEKHLLQNRTELTDDVLRNYYCLECLIYRLEKQINILQKNCGQQELFIKTSAKSTKHDVSVQPITDARQAMNYLLSSPTIQGVLARDETVELFLRPWNTEVNNDNEIRVFIQNGYIKAVSQQYIYESSPVLGTMFQYNAFGILEKITDVWQQIQSCTSYKDAVLDMFITCEGDVKLIEVNCGGTGWGPAGSSLFQWTEINAIEPGTCVFASY